MTRNLWINMAVIAAGVVALSAVIWFAAPLLAIAGVHPFESEGVRLVSVLVVCLCGMGSAAWMAYSSIKASRALGSAMAEGQDEDDSAVLRTRMKEALETLRASGKANADYLYDLPWYIIIGPPGSGKTTALVNSGLKFPLAGGQTPAAIAGIGGTRYCDWWFTEDAVLVDTAGRYTTQDSNAALDRRSWLSFLGLLKKHRPRQPINGVIIALSIADLVSLDEAERTAHAAAVRSRLTELHDLLKIDFPVYVLFTKMDLIAGFTEFFADLGEMQRRRVWGATFQDPKKNQNLVGRVPEEFDALLERLSEFLPDRLQAENDPTARLRIFGFPAQFVTLKTPIVTFLGRIFEPTRYHSNATLRGFYFTSGTQQGTPIDRIIGSLSQSFGAQALGEGYLSGTGRSFFLNDLVRKVIIGEAAWVSTDRAAVRRNFILTTCGYVVLALATAGAVAAWTTSYTRNEQLIARTQDEAATYKRNAAAQLDIKVVGDRKFEQILPRLEELRRLPAGYATKDDPTPLTEQFGLSQRDRLTSSGLAAYRAGLERYLRPRLLYRLEEQLNAASAAGPTAVQSKLYEPFKVYLMLGGQGPVDKGIILDWAREDFANVLYPGPEKAGMRRALEDHIAAMLELDTGTAANIPLNGPLIEDVRRMLIRMNVAERAYQILRSRTHSGRVSDWVLGKAVTDAASVFATVNGSGIDTVRVPGFFTYDGFQVGLIEALPGISAQLEKDRWVLGEGGQMAVVGAQFDTLSDDILKLYARDFIKAWADALNRLRIRPLTADKPQYAVLYAISAAASPFKQIFEEIRIQTQLSRPAKAPDAAAGAAPARPPVVFSTGTSAGRAIEDYFRPFYAVLDQGQGGRPVDLAVGYFSDIYNGLVGTLNDASRSNQMTGATRESIRNLRVLATRFPAPFAQMLRAATDDLEGNVASVVLGDLQKSLSETVTQACQQIIAGRYPFSRNAELEVQPIEFGRLFSPGGIMDRFFKEELAPLVEQRGTDMVWRRESKVGALLSPAALQHFQRAALIRDAFFAAGGNQPSFTFSVLPLTANDPMTQIVLDINGTRIVSPAAPAQPQAAGLFAPRPQPAPAAAPPAPVTLQWPGPVGASRVSLIATPVVSTANPYTLFEKTGTWALFRAFDASKVIRQGNDTVLAMRAGSESARDIRYQFNVASAVNPLTLTALREFQCPTTLQ